MPFRPCGGTAIKFRKAGFLERGKMRGKGVVSFLLQRGNKMLTELYLDLFTKNARPYPPFRRITLLSLMIAFRFRIMGQYPAYYAKFSSRSLYFRKGLGEYFQGLPVEITDMVFEFIIEGIATDGKAYQRFIPCLVSLFLL